MVLAIALEKLRIESGYAAIATVDDSGLTQLSPAIVKHGEVRWESCLPGSHAVIASSWVVTAAESEGAIEILFGIVPFASPRADGNERLTVSSSFQLVRVSVLVECEPGTEPSRGFGVSHRFATLDAQCHGGRAAVLLPTEGTVGIFSSEPPSELRVIDLQSAKAHDGVSTLHIVLPSRSR